MVLVISKKSTPVYCIQHGYKKKRIQLGHMKTVRVGLGVFVIRDDKILLVKELTISVKEPGSYLEDTWNCMKHLKNVQEEK